MFARIASKAAGLLFFILVVGLVNPGQSAAQQLGKKELDDAYNKTTVQRRKLFSGERTPQGPEDQKIMEVTARWFVDPSTLKTTTSSETMAKLHENLDRDLVQPLL